MEGKPAPGTFREWLRDALEESGMSRKGLARKVAEGHPHGATESTIETARRSIRRILDGTLNPSQPTRDAIEEALGRDDAPTVEEEAASEAVARERAFEEHVNALRQLALGSLV